MMDVGFSESVAGGLQIALPKDGEVVVFAGDLSEGPLLDLMEGAKERRRAWRGLYKLSPEIFQEVAAVYQQAFARVVRAAREKEAVRVWLMPDDPEDLCGFCCLCRILRDSDVPLQAVLLPRWEEKEGSLICYRNSGEYDPNRYRALCAGAFPVSRQVKRAAADRWDACVAENAPLRAVVNGRLTGAPQDLYDSALRESFPQGEFPLALLLGRALARAPGASIRWLFLRVLKMIQEGELCTLSPAEEQDLYRIRLIRGDL